MRADRSGNGSWITWVEQARAGDRAAFDRLVLRFQDLAFATAVAWLRDPTRAEDAAQDAFLEAYLQLDRLRSPAAFPGFLRTLVRKHCDRRTRRRTESGRDPALAPAPTPAPDARHAAREEGARLRLAVDALPAGQRIVVALHYVAGLSQRECAEWLELPLTTVKKRLHDARQRLRIDLESNLRKSMEELKPSKDSRFSETLDFFLALRCGDVAATRRALDRNPALLDAPERWDAELAEHHALPPATGATPLVRAAERGHGALVALLLERGAAVDAPCPCAGGETPLWAAVANGAPETAALLLSHGADPDAPSFAGHTPLHVAAIRGCERSVELLLGRGADPGRRDREGRTAGDWARAKGHEAIAARLPAGRATPPAQPSTAPSPPGSPPLWETGIRALDLLVGLHRGERVLCRYRPGQGAIVLLGELSLRLAREQARPAVVWVGWERHAVDRSEIAHAFDELDLHGHVELVWSPASERLDERQAAVRRGVEAARRLRERGARHVAVAVLSSPAWRADVEASLPLFGGDGHGSIGAWVFERSGEEASAGVPEGYHARIALDAELVRLGVLPAVDARHSAHRRGDAPLAARVRGELCWLRQRFPRLACPPDAEVDDATRERAARARALQDALTQPFLSAEVFTGRPAESTPLADTLATLESLLAGGEDAEARRDSGAASNRG